MRLAVILCATYERTENFGFRISDFGFRNPQSAIRNERRSFAHGESTIEMVVLIMAIIAALLAMCPMLKRVIAGSLHQAFVSGQGPYAPGDTTGQTTLTVTGVRRDEFVGQQVTQPDGTKKLVTAITSADVSLYGTGPGAQTTRVQRHEVIQPSPQ